MYGATKAALERFTQGLAEEVAECGNIAVTAVSPSRVVPTPGTVHHKLVEGMDDPKGEPPSLMAQASLLLATEPVEKVNGRGVALVRAINLLTPRRLQLGWCQPDQCT